jgi:shikimate dehydrogenase
VSVLALTQAHHPNSSLAGDALDALIGASLVISTLPAGAADPLAAAGPAALALVAGQSLLDVVYDPWPTPLAAAAAAAGCSVISGAAMLLHQAAAQVRLMTGCAAPVAAMRAALRQAAPGCGV